MNEDVSCFNTICPYCCLSRSITENNARNIPTDLSTVSVPYNITISPGYKDQAMFSSGSGQSSVFCQRISCLWAFDGPLEISPPSYRACFRHNPIVAPPQFYHRQALAPIVTAQPASSMSSPSVMPAEKDTSSIQLHI